MGGYALGGHIFANFTNLAYLIIPDLLFPRVKDFLNQNFPLGIQLSHSWIH